MKILKLLNKKILSIIVLLFCSYTFSFAEDEPVDIWNINKNKNEKTRSENITIKEETKPEEITFDSDIYKMQPKNNPNLIELDKGLLSKEMNIFGLYDPEDYDFVVKVGDSFKNWVGTSFSVALKRLSSVRNFKYWKSN